MLKKGIIRMNLIIIGNIIALIAASISIIIGIIKNRKKIIYIQTIQFFTYTISNLVLGGISGAIADLIGMVRNILSYKEKLTKFAITLILVISTILTLMFNNLGFIGLLPLFSTIIYTVFINEKNPLKFKLLFLITAILWFFYDFAIKAYTSATFDFFTIITSSVTAYQIYKDNKKQNKQQN